jgi:hypothetical protein
MDMTIAFAVLDDGISNAIQAQTGKTAVYEHDFTDGDGETDGGVARNHGSGVAYAALRTSAAYDLVDLKVSPTGAGYCTYEAVAQALDALANGIAAGHHVNTVNMSFGGTFCPDYIHTRIDALTAQGVIFVAASGTAGSAGRLEWADDPAGLPNVLSVGAHDGAGHPSWFSQQGRNTDLLADGENFPWPSWTGTSFAAPQVAATVVHVQAIGEGLTGVQMSVGQVVDALKAGGTGPRSLPDPANDSTRYFLESHARAVDYAWNRYGGNPTTALEYIASHEDLIAAFGANAAAGKRHYVGMGAVEERAITFDGLDYVASYEDLSSTFGASAQAGATHYIRSGVHEGREIGFDGLEYIATYDDLMAAYGANHDAGSTHFIRYGRAEQRAVGFDGLEYVASYGDLIAAFGPSEDKGATHFITAGRFEHRQTSFDGLQYIASHTDLIVRLGADRDAGSTDYITAGYRAGRAPDSFDAAQYLANYEDLRDAFGSDEDAATVHYITAGYYEGRTDAAASDFIV